VLSDSDKLQERWKEYTEDLCAKTNKPQEDIHLDTEDVKGPLILFIEFEAALSELKNVKAEGKGGMPTELLTVLGAKDRRELYDIVMKYTLGITGQMIQIFPTYNEKSTRRDANIVRWL